MRAKEHATSVKDAVVVKCADGGVGLDVCEDEPLSTEHAQRLDQVVDFLNPHPQVARGSIGIARTDWARDILLTFLAVAVIELVCVVADSVFVGLLDDGAGGAQDCFAQMGRYVLNVPVFDRE